MTTIIRSAGVGDAQAIARVLVTSSRSAYAGILPESYLAQLSESDLANPWRRNLARVGEGQMVTVVAQEADGRVVGFAAGGRNREVLPGYDAELYAIYLEPTAQGLGIGQRLLGEWSRLALQASFRAAIVRVLSANPACQFYERHAAQLIRETILELDGHVYPERWFGWDDLTTLSGY